MAKRHDLRALYIQGWYDLDIDKLMAATAEEFIFDDPAEAAPVTRLELPDYMARWTQRAGQHQDWLLTHEVRQDKDGVLTDWEWWEVRDTPLQGTAVVLTSDQGVTLERITYYNGNFARE